MWGTPWNLQDPQVTCGAPHGLLGPPQSAMWGTPQIARTPKSRVGHPMDCWDPQVMCGAP